ncbi:MAG: family 10 glycosylhydrolase [Clostridia bacterium]|nr:family 10 glycosylhydrolase [Clostridia bacterium]
MKKRDKRLICTFLAIVLMFVAFPGRVQAEVKPWDTYMRYIPDKTPLIKRHLRGAWICTVANMDWPLAETRKIVDDASRVKKSKDELVAILDKAVEMNMNAVFFQVSPEGDAFYQSKIVPWSRYLTGTFGKDPGFDPLAFAIEEAHKRNLELHAWFNPYRISVDVKDTTINSLNIEKSVYKDHPDWVKTSMDRFVVDPGIPDARKWVEERVLEVANNYDIDGVHFDDYFYYERFEGELKDGDTYRKYNNGRFASLGDWRRNNTYLLVKGVSKKIRAAKSWVKFGISPSGVWGNKKDGHADGSNTNTSYTNYERCFADTKRWVEEELIDYIAPQIYFTFANTRAPYGELASWWSRICKDKKVHLYVGLALYKVNEDPDQYFKGENAVPEFSRQLKFNAAKPEVQGSIMFRIQNFNDLSKQTVASAIKGDLWSSKAIVPAMEWKGGKTPGVPSKGKIEVRPEGIKLYWNDNDANTNYYAVYRFDNSERAETNSDASASKLIATVKRNSTDRQEFIDKGISNPNNVYYVVTALDRLHNESSGLRISIHQSKYFPDVGMEYAWAVKAIDVFFEKGIIKGDEKGRFNPGKSTKRGDFILMVVKALNLKADFESNFPDVKKGAYYYDAIGTAKSLGIAKGNGTTFNPEGSITREDMMVIIVRAFEAAGIQLEKAGEEYLEGYHDARFISGYAKEAVASLTKAGAVQGAGGTVKPKSLAARAELTVILYRVLSSFAAGF